MNDKAAEIAAAAERRMAEMMDRVRASGIKVAPSSNADSAERGPRGVFRNGRGAA